MKVSGWTAIAFSIGLAACGSNDRADEKPVEAATAADPAAVAASGAPVTAAANLLTALGGPAGTATATQSDGAVQISFRGEGLPPGPHGIHVHMVGKCDGPKFETAGGHWNPQGKKHGIDNPEGQHAGDMPNLVVGSDGRGMVTYALKGATMEGLLDEDGSAIIVHARADDQKTDPSGDSGDRIACGVFSPG